MPGNSPFLDGFGYFCRILCAPVIGKNTDLIAELPIINIVSHIYVISILFVKGLIDFVKKITKNLDIVKKPTYFYAGLAVLMTGICVNYLSMSD